MYNFSTCSLDQCRRIAAVAKKSTSALVEVCVCVTGLPRPSMNTAGPDKPAPFSPLDIAASRAKNKNRRRQHNYKERTFSFNPTTPSTLFSATSRARVKMDDKLKGEAREYGRPQKSNVDLLSTTLDKKEKSRPKFSVLATTTKRCCVSLKQGDGVRVCGQGRQSEGIACSQTSASRGAHETYVNHIPILCLVRNFRRQLYTQRHLIDRKASTENSTGNVI